MRAFLLEIQPFLVAKRSQADMMIAHWTTRNPCIKNALAALKSNCARRL